MMLNTEAIDNRLQRLNNAGETTVSLSLLRIIVSSTIILKMIITIPYYATLFSNVSVANAFDLKTIALTYTVTGTCLVSACLWLIGYQNRFMLFVLFVAYLIHIRLLPLTTYGGDNVTSILLLFVPLLHTTQKMKLYKYSTTDLEAAPYALAAIKFTFCGIYFFSAVYKFTDPEWVRGNALSILLKLDAYNATPFNNMISDSGTLAKILTWFTLLLELLIPFTIWFEKLRKPSIIIAVSFHLFIMIFMHIYRFELVMIAMVLLFIKDEEWTRIPPVKYWIQPASL